MTEVTKPWQGSLFSEPKHDGSASLPDEEHSRIAVPDKRKRARLDVSLDQVEVNHSISSTQHKLQPLQKPIHQTDITAPVFPIDDLLIEAVLDGNAQSIRSVLADHGPVIEKNPRSNKLTNPLVAAVRLHKLDCLRALLDGEIKPDIRFESGRTALMVAVQEGYPSMVRELLSYGADPDLDNDYFVNAREISNVCAASGDDDALECRKLIEENKRVP